MGFDSVIFCSMVYILGYYWFSVTETVFNRSSRAEKSTKFLPITSMLPQPALQLACARALNRHKTLPSPMQPSPTQNRILTKIAWNETKSHWNEKFKPLWDVHNSYPGCQICLRWILSSQLVMKCYWVYICKRREKHFLKSQQHKIHTP